MDGLKTFDKKLVKKLTLIILGMVVLVLLIALGDIYLQKQISQIESKRKIIIEQFISEQKKKAARKNIEQQIEEAMKNCQTEFDLNKLDFKKPIWDSELSVMLPYLIAMEAFEQGNEEKCDYFKDLKEINSDLTIDECQRRYRFLDLTASLKKGMSCQNYIEECEKLANIEIEGSENEKETFIKLVCESLCQSYQNKAAVITEPENLCDEEPSLQGDAVSYLDAKTNQQKTCFGGITDEIKFLIAVAKDDSNSCLDIKNSKTSSLCQFYFDRDLIKYQNKFKEAYCHDLVQRVIIPPE